MIKLFLGFFKRYLYIISLSGFIFFLALAFSSPSQKIFSNLYQQSDNEKELILAVQNWQDNALQFKKYLESTALATDNKTERFKKYNDFSAKNNSSMQQVFNFKTTKQNSKAHNMLAKYSVSLASYFQDSQKYVDTGTTTTTQLPELSHEELQKNLGSGEVNESVFFFGLSIFCLGLTVVHLLFLYRSTQKQNVTLNSKLDTLKQAISNMTEGVIVTDKYGFFTFSNESAKNIIGPVVNDIFYPSSVDVIGFHTADGRKLSKEELPMQAALKKGLIIDQEILVKNSVHPQGIFVSCSNGYFVDARGVTSGSVVVLKNITAKKQLEQFWQTEKERALENSKMKSDFLASMSHEIRTPMNAVLGLTTLLKETNLNGDQKDYVLTIQRSAKALLTLINDILDHSKIEAGKLEIIHSPFNLKTLAKDIADNFKPLVMEKNIELKLDFSSLNHASFNSDGNRIRQILINLIGNAIKFTKIGSVELKFESLAPTSADTKSIQHVKFTIKDTGSGMTPVEVSHLFQKYFQTKGGQTAGGTGLGLSICKQLVDLLKGEIGVTSEVGIGTQFWFTLPLQTVAEIEHNAEQDTETKLFSNQFDGLILIAEDSTVNQKVITNYLNKLGLKTIVANNGQEAIELYQTHSPDLILMDSNMPVMSGREATEKIIELQKSGGKKTPVIGLSADVRQKNQEENLKAGMTAFLSKPVELDKLVAMLKQHFTAIEATPSQMEKIKDLFVGDQLLVEVLLADFTAQAPEILQKLPELLRSKNFTELYQTAHSLKSAAAELDALDLRTCLQKIEQLADSDQADKHITDIQNEISLATELYPKAIAMIQEKIDLIKTQKRQAS